VRTGQAVLEIVQETIRLNARLLDATIVSSAYRTTIYSPLAWRLRSLLYPEIVDI